MKSLAIAKLSTLIPEPLHFSSAEVYYWTPEALIFAQKLTPTCNSDTAFTVVGSNYSFFTTQINGTQTQIMESMRDPGPQPNPVTPAPTMRPTTIAPVPWPTNSPHAYTAYPAVVYTFSPTLVLDSSQIEALAIIVVSCVVGVAGLAGAFVLYRRRRRRMALETASTLNQGGQVVASNTSFSRSAA